MSIKVLHVVQSLDPSWGGIARVLPQLASGVKGHGIESRIATLAGGRYGRPPTDIEVRLDTFAGQDSRLGWSGDFSRAARDLVGWADVVHLHGLWTHLNWCAGPAARRAGKPYIMTPHSMMMPWAWKRSWYKKRPAGWLFEHKNLRHAAKLHALSEGEAGAIRALGFNDRVETIPNGVHPAEFDSPPPPDTLYERFPGMRDKRWMLFLSRVHPQKGIVALLQGCFDAAPAAADWSLMIAGPDEIGLRKQLEPAVQRKGLADRVVFTGMLSRDEARAALGRAEVFVQPSRSEGLSMAILEAMAARLPVVISPACNMPEVAEKDAGRIVASDRRSIAGALRELLAMPVDELRAIGDRARGVVEDRYAWDVVLPRYAAMYAGCANR